LASQIAFFSFIQSLKSDAVQKAARCRETVISLTKEDLAVLYETPDQLDPTCSEYLKDSIFIF
jgi:hypothetical protein